MACVCYIYPRHYDYIVHKIKILSLFEKGTWTCAYARSQFNFSNSHQYPVTTCRIVIKLGRLFFFLFLRGVTEIWDMSFVRRFSRESDDDDDVEFHLSVCLPTSSRLHGKTSRQRYENDLIILEHVPLEQGAVSLVRGTHNVMWIKVNDLANSSSFRNTWNCFLFFFKIYR